jgi:hypothetical protein
LSNVIDLAAERARRDAAARAEAWRGLVLVGLLLFLFFTWWPMPPRPSE